MTAGGVVGGIDAAGAPLLFRASGSTSGACRAFSISAGADGRVGSDASCSDVASPARVGSDVSCSAGAPGSLDRDAPPVAHAAGRRAASNGDRGMREAFSLVICGSPRTHGVSARYAEKLADGLANAGERVARWNVADHDVHGCIGCEACRRAPHACVVRDDMDGLYALFDAAASLHVVCPVYFAGPPAQFKCVLDRLQPYWEVRRGPNRDPRAASAPKRPLTLHVIGAGGDPFGFEPLSTIVRSAFGSAGWSVVDVFDRIGWGQPADEQEKERFS